MAASSRHSVQTIRKTPERNNMNGPLEEKADADCLKKRVLVVGAGGRLGRSLVEVLRQRHAVVGLGRKELDLASADSIARTLEPLDYDFLFLTGALTGVDYCETHEAEAFAVNADGPGRIAEISARKGAHVTYLSTDMVFDGSKVEPYQESDQTEPISVYGASKLAGERRVLAASPDGLVARVSWVFGPGRPAFPEWIINQACANSNLTLPGNKIGCPTYTLDLIEWLEALVLGRVAGPASGVFHLCNSEPCTWRDWGQFCMDAAREAGLPVIAEEIEGIPVDSVAAFVARRPVNSALDTGKFTRLTGIRPRSWRDAIRVHVMQNIPPSG
jgi:dTDP-4-dehydrorhamnose reductase